MNKRVSNNRSSADVPSAAIGDARGDLAVWLEDYAAGRCDRARMQASFLEICRSNPEAPWDALALLDQYQRRGRIDSSLARSLKSDIAQLVFGVVNQTEDEDAAAEPAGKPDTTAPESPTTDPTGTESTGTRWRRLAAETGNPAPGSPPEPTFADPLQIARDVDPQTRPPPAMRRTREAANGGADSSVLRDRYELLTILGRDSTSTTYKAYDRRRSHLEAAAQCVALRIFREEFREPSVALTELERHFHIAQSLSHPNIERVFDLDRDGSTYFMVIELSEGELLADRLRRPERRSMPREQALGIIQGIGAGLAHAHARGVAHGDLQPAHIMVGPGDNVKILRMGMARRERIAVVRPEPWVGDEARIAVDADERLGANLAYASQSQVNGEAAEPQDDVYSFACIAYELLCGQHPFGGRSEPLARAHGRPPERISGLSGRQWSALRSGLGWSREEGFIDAAGLTEALTGSAKSTASWSPFHDAGRRPGFHRFGLFSTALLALLLIGGIGAFVWIDGGPIERFSGEPTAVVEQTSETASDPVTLPAAAPVAEADPTLAASAAETATPPPAVEPVLSESVSTPATPAPQTATPVEAAPARSEPAGPVRIGFDREEYTGAESDGSVRLTIRRSGSARSAATFSWALVPGSAEAGEDFADIGPRTETMAAGERSMSLIVPFVSDSIKESTELFAIELSEPGEGIELGPLSRATVVIVDDD